MVEAQVMDLSVVCQNFPTMEGPQIRRENIIEAIDTMFGGDTRLVVVEGGDSIGKTNLLAQFVLKHPHHALSLFVSYTSRWAYDPKILRLDLYNQLYWALYKERPNIENIEESNLSVMFSKLHEYARRNQELFYFVLDGLDEVPREDEQTRHLILDILPFGFNQFRFLLAGDYNQIAASIASKIASKPYQLSGFTLDETVRYLEDLVKDRGAIEDLYQLCRKVPGHLASVRRLLDSGTSVQSILEGDPTKPLDFLELEWASIDEKDEEQSTVLAILAHDRKRHSIDGLARILNIEPSKVEASLRGLGFVDIDHKTQSVSFISEAFRKFAARKLYYLKDRVNELLIADLMKDPSGDEALTYLPVYFEQAGDYEQILKYLSPEHFAKMLESSQSLSPVQQKADLGVSAARKLGRDWDLMRFSMQKSALTELGVSEEWRAEIEAKVALNDYDAALTLAQSTVLKEDRLRLLAIIGRQRREQGLPLNQELTDQIRQLYSEIDQKVLAKRATEIASDLIFSIPELAIELVEKVTDAGEGENALDWALASLSVTALFASTNQMSAAGQDNAETNESIRSRIKDPKARRFTAAASLYFKEFSAAQIIAEAEKLEGASDRLYLLRKWTRNNRERSDAAEVIEYALKIAIRTTPYTFNATVLRELALPLPFIPDESQVRHLVGVFDSQQGTVEPLGPTEDFVRLQLLLARAEIKYDPEAARNRVGDVYLKVSFITDLDLKAVCLAWLVSSLAVIDPEMKFETESSDRIHSAAQEEFNISLEKLLNSTADHYQVTRRSVRALAKFKPDLAINVAMSLNTESRRDAALLELFESAVQVPINKIDLDFLEKALDQFVDLNQQDEALLAVIERLTEEPGQIAQVITRALPFFNRIEKIHSADERTRACYLSYTLLMGSDADKHAELASRLLNLMDDSWQSIDVGWEKIEVGFRIAGALSKYSVEKAQEYIERIERFRDEISMDVGATALAYLGCLRLAVRSYSGLLPKNIDTPEDLARLADLIDILPSRGERAGFWAEVAVRSFLKGRVDQCKRIVTDHVIPLLQSIPDNDSGYMARVVITIAPALHCGHAQTALETISTLPANDKDSAYWQIGDFILRKLPHSDPYEGSVEQGYDVQYTDIVDICELMKLMQADGTIYYFIKSISNTLVSSRFKDRFSRTQKLDILRRFREVIDSKLPDPRNIKHEGYKVASEVQFARIQNSIQVVNSRVWDDLATAAEALPNLADSAYVLGILASAMPSREAVKKSQMIDRSRDLIRVIPAHFDKIEHYEYLAAMVVDSNSVLAKKCIEEAMQASVESNDPDLYPAQRRLIDLAYRIDPSLAATMASLADNDPAKDKCKANLQRQLGVLTLKKRMIDQSSSGGELSKADKKNFPTAAWRNLGALNANRIAHLHVEHTREWVQAAASLPINKSYSILAWVIENANRRFSNTDQARTHLRPIFEATLQGAALCGQMAARSLVIVKRAKNLAAKASDGSSLLVRAGNREGALEFLRDWFTNGVEEYIKICDPYFGPEELQVLQLIQSAKPNCRVQILTSRKHNEKITASLEDAFRSHWRMSFDQDPPDTEIVVAGTDIGGDFPIHDRWWLTKGGGIRIGTSFNYLGLKKDSEISILTKEEADSREREIDQYLHRSKREHQGRRLLYSLFTL